MTTLAGKSAIITGAAGGIGRAAALAFGAAGARLVLADVARDAGEETAAMVRKAGGTATFVHADVSLEADVERVVRAAVEHYGKLDCAFNNAGITGSIELTADLSFEAWEKVLRVNLSSVFLCVKHEIRAMLKTGGGAIVNTSSGLGLVAQSGCTAYSASKAGVLAVTRGAAIEYARQKIRVNALTPGVVRTGLLVAASKEVNDLVESKHPIGRIAEPNEIAAVALFLCSDAASFMTGSAVAVDGGYMAV